MPSTLRLRCPAKINLHLRVGPRRADGFHPLLSWMCSVGLFDQLTLEAGDAPGDVQTGAGRAPVIELACDAPGVPSDARNLVVRVAEAWRDDAARAGGTWPAALRAVLEKRIPAGAGLGGGSSDAARMILGLDRLCRAGRAADDLSAFAARFGSDLSFFLYGPSSVCTGRGEVVRPVARPAARWAVLVLPAMHVPTPDVYRRFDAMGLGRERDVADAPDWPAWAALGAADLMPRLVNDLEPPAFALRPALDELRRAVEREIDRVVRMSGSGSSLFTLFDERAEADAAAGRIADRFGVRAEAVEVAPAIDDDLGAAPGDVN